MNGDESPESLYRINSGDFIEVEFDLEAFLQKIEEFQMSERIPAGDIPRTGVLVQNVFGAQPEEFSDGVAHQVTGAKTLRFFRGR